MRGASGTFTCNSSQRMTASHPQADDAAEPSGLAGGMNNETASQAGAAIDPTAIELLGTYVIDLTLATGSDIAVPDAWQPVWGDGAVSVRR